MINIPKISLPKKPTYIKLAEDINFFALFEKIDQQFDTCFIFESLGEDSKFSRYSLIGFAPQHSISAKHDTLEFDGVKYKVKNPYETLRKIMPNKTISHKYAGGLVGYISYDAINYIESSIQVKVHDQFEQFMFGVYTDGLLFDKQTNELLYFYYTIDRSKIIKQILTSKKKKQKIKIQTIGDSLSIKEHTRIVEIVKKHIISGNTFQCEVGFKTEFSVQGNTILIYKKLRKINPSPFMYYVKFKGKKIIGASPELLFSLQNGEMTTKPLAGTIRRGKNKIEDQKLARKLLHDQKEIAEHAMLVDLHRNDIGKVAQFGSVKIKELMSIKKFSHVQHISSEITGLIRSNEDMFSGFAANFPMGTLTGAPKIESIKIIDSNEKTARGPYGGGVGHFGFNGDCTFAIAIRSLFVSGEYAYAQTSGGIVYDSQPDKEFEEIKRKLAAMQAVINSI